MRSNNRADSSDRRLARALLQSVGANANDAKRLLKTFEIYLTLFKDYLRELRQKPP